jgi:hypothetical protein
LVWREAQMVMPRVMITKATNRVRERVWWLTRPPPSP